MQLQLEHITIENESHSSSYHPSGGPIKLPKLCIKNFSGGKEGPCHWNYSIVKLKNNIRFKTI